MNILSKIFYKSHNKNGMLSKPTMEIVLKKRNNSIIFKNINPNDLSSFEYKAIQPNNIVSSLSSGAIQAGSIALSNPKGLFTASVSPKILSLFRDGSFSTIIRGQDGRILKNAGFLSSNATVFAPIIVYQILSFITGKYYLDGINKQLSSIQEGINELIYYHHVERIATIKAAFEYLQGIYLKNNPSLEHLNALEKLEIDILIIKNEYCTYLNDIDWGKVIKLEKWLSYNKIRELCNNFNYMNKKYFNYIRLIQNCEELLHLITIFKLIVTVRIFQNDNNRYNQMIELLDFIEKWNPQNTYLNKNNEILHEKLFNSYNIIYRKALNIQRKSIDFDNLKNIDNIVVELYNCLNQNLEAHKYQIRKNIEMVNNGKILVSEINRDMNLLYAPNENIMYLKSN